MQVAVHRPMWIVGMALVVSGACGDLSRGQAARNVAIDVAPARVVSNDNRTPGGTVQDGVLELDLVARLARWEGEPSDLAADAEDPSVVTVLAFAEAGGPPRVPGPLIRVPQGTEVRIRIRNSIPDSAAIGLPPPPAREPGMRAVADPVLIVHGLRAGTVMDDTIHVARGEVREVRYRAEVPGTYLYRAAASTRPIEAWTGRDATLAGAIVVDPAGTEPDPVDRIFVITMLDQYPDPGDLAQQDELFRRAINGRSWPETERFEHQVGDTVRWRWLNASAEPHPMHLHGFHYRVLSRGDGRTDTAIAPAQRPWVVTEHMKPGSTFSMEWVPTEDGNWIFHCHILDHIVPAIERDEAARTADVHDVEQHALDAMAGLVVGVTVTRPGSEARDTTSRRRLRLLAQQRRLDDGRLARGFVLVDGSEPPPDSVAVPSSPIVVTRDETTAITVVNRLTEPTTVHWHGLELESVFDGVAGWSRTGLRIAPLIAPGDSFAVRITPPRAGTFIYHTHMDETSQLAQGMMGAFIVLEPGETFDSDRDRIFLMGGMQEGDYPVNINGSVDPPAAELRVGTPYRLRFIHITRGLELSVELARGSTPVVWRALAKDGADLPAALRIRAPARFDSNTGETFDFEWTPPAAGDFILSVRYQRFEVREQRELTQILRVR